ncbi:HDR022Wp [Eremothecium sinecaudum]|uniref:HDR022Wp n=1 Tax=Eremothecium sinecaudum TaxID=45286 RepID=A0A0X8HSR7_9SACH|nr:HDR022Wp [Eremothecium sinecaudum]AMD20765.1 HDR022Wp [Eremothecium sinecaudum]
MLPSFIVFVTLLSAFSSLGFANPNVYAPFAITLPPFSKECLYYDMIDNKDSIVISYQVLTGGNFEIDFQITDPSGKAIVEQKQKKYSDFLLKSFGLGQYSFCFTNSYGTALKRVEITLELQKQILEEAQPPEDIVANNAVEEIDRNLKKITKSLNYLRAREWRNMSTVASTKSRLVWLSILTMGVMVGISVLQSLIVQYFFKDRHRNYV